MARGVGSGLPATSVRDYIVATANTWTAGQVFNLGTLAANAPVIDGSITWNNAAVNFSGMKLNVTNSASAASSVLADFQVGGASRVALWPGNGVNATSGISLGVLGNGVRLLQNANALFVLTHDASYAPVYGSVFGLGGDAFLHYDGSNRIGFRNGTVQNVFSHYDTHSSSVDYHRLSIRTARATLSAVSGASVTASALIPAGSILMGLTSKVTVGLGTSNGTTGYQIGDGSDADRWGSIAGTAAGTSSDNRNWTAGGERFFPAAQNIVITAVGGNFNGTGTIYISAQYITGEAD